jgi:hypothetical protein
MSEVIQHVATKLEVNSEPRGITVTTPQGATSEQNFSPSIISIASGLEFGTMNCIQSAAD